MVGAECYSVPERLDFDVTECLLEMFQLHSM